MIKKISTVLAKGTLFAASIMLIVAMSALTFESYIYDYKGSSVVKLTRTSLARSGGTGFSIKAPSGKLYTLTNAHICQIGQTLVAHRQDGKMQTVSVVKIYPEHDLCIMTAVQGVRPLSIASSLKKHERLWLIGHPSLRDATLESGHFVGPTTIRLRSKCSPRHQQTVNAILTKNPNLIGIIVAQQYQYLFCTKEMTANHINNIAYGGNSGSPVLNKFGNVVGVLYAGSPSQPTASYIVPLKEVHKFLKDL